MLHLNELTENWTWTLRQRIRTAHELQAVLRSRAARSKRANARTELHSTTKEFQRQYEVRKTWKS